MAKIKQQDMSVHSHTHSSDLDRFEKSNCTIRVACFGIPAVAVSSFTLHSLVPEVDAAEPS